MHGAQIRNSSGCSQTPVTGAYVSYCCLSWAETYFVAATVILVVVGGDGSRYFYAQFLRFGSDLCDVKDVDSRSLVGRLVNEEVGIVVVANGYGNYLHGSISR